MPDRHLVEVSGDGCHADPAGSLERIFDDAVRCPTTSPPTPPHQALRRDVLDGLQQTPKSLPPKWFYDSVGSDLFDQITRLPEYYPTRAEARDPARAVSRDRRGQRGRHPGRTGQRHVGEDPACCSTRCATADRCAVRAVRRRRQHPVDGRDSASSSEYPGVEIDAVCGDFEEHLAEIPAGGRRLFVFLGSTIGNLTPGPRAEFLPTLAARAAAGGQPAAGHRSGQGHRPAGARLRRRRRGDGAVQPQRAGGDQPGTRRRLRPRRLRARGPLERRRGTHRDVAAGQPRAAGAHRRARPDRRLRGRRGDAHRGVVQVPARTASTPNWPAPGCAAPSGGPTAQAISGCRWP